MVAAASLFLASSSLSSSPVSPAHICPFFLTPASFTLASLSLHALQARPISDSSLMGHFGAGGSARRLIAAHRPRGCFYTFDAPAFSTDGGAAN